LDSAVHSATKTTPAKLRQGSLLELLLLLLHLVPRHQYG
jgi:hypothetical protein